LNNEETQLQLSALEERLREEETANAQLAASKQALVDELENLTVVCTKSGTCVRNMATPTQHNTTDFNKIAALFALIVGL
jgi:hypothetical protein